MQLATIAECHRTNQLFIEGHHELQHSSTLHVLTFNDLLQLSLACSPPESV